MCTKGLRGFRRIKKRGKEQKKRLAAMDHSRSPDLPSPLAVAVAVAVAVGRCRYPFANCQLPTANCQSLKKNTGGLI
jgi:hypothetical protein